MGAPAAVAGADAGGGRACGDPASFALAADARARVEALVGEFEALGAERGRVLRTVQAVAGELRREARQAGRRPVGRPARE
ncbi:MAG: hypothetical protein LBD51_03325 [Bifidobacteriaceae bacterium]|jgi:hypothetical protein|nr:hypothetical protein [Bifidobacteriaceae bacterium]